MKSVPIHANPGAWALLCLVRSVFWLCCVSRPTQERQSVLRKVTVRCVHFLADFNSIWHSTLSKQKYTRYHQVSCASIAVVLLCLLEGFPKGLVRPPLEIRRICGLIFLVARLPT
ncbi:hypothetical protein C8R47DRAFT_513895 [Mycena vitilis]|nr:hypothetical protein C8R47DRAFT_513895 [Mycena vitilis]